MDERVRSTITPQGRIILMMSFVLQKIINFPQYIPQHNSFRRTEQNTWNRTNAGLLSSCLEDVALDIGLDYDLN